MSAFHKKKNTMDACSVCRTFAVTVFIAFFLWCVSVLFDSSLTHSRVLLISHT